MLGEIVCDQSNTGMDKERPPYLFQIQPHQRLEHRLLLTDCLPRREILTLMSLKTSTNFERRVITPHTWLTLPSEHLRQLNIRWMGLKTRQWFCFSATWRGRLHRFLAARSNCHLVTCARLISDTSSCQTACSRLHNTNEQLSRTDKHTKKWPSKLFLSSLKTSALPFRQPVQQNMHVCIFWSSWRRQVDYQLVPTAAWLCCLYCTVKNIY